MKTSDAVYNAVLTLRGLGLKVRRHGRRHLVQGVSIDGAHLLALAAIAKDILQTATKGKNT